MKLIHLHLKNKLNIQPVTKVKLTPIAAYHKYDMEYHDANWKLKKKIRKTIWMMLLFQLKSEIFQVFLSFNKIKVVFKI